MCLVRGNWDGNGGESQIMYERGIKILIGLGFGFYENKFLTCFPFLVVIQMNGTWTGFPIPIPFSSVPNTSLQLSYVKALKSMTMFWCLLYRCKMNLRTNKH